MSNGRTRRRARALHRETGWPYDECERLVAGVDVPIECAPRRDEEMIETAEEGSR